LRLAARTQRPTAVAKIAITARVCVIVTTATVSSIVVVGTGRNLAKVCAVGSMEEKLPWAASPESAGRSYLPKSAAQGVT